MADIKWSAFPTTVSLTSGDTLVGLHSGANYQFTGLTIPFSPAVGGTGIDNGVSTITIGGALAFSGAFTFVGTLTGNTTVTFPTSGTLATTSELPSLPLSLANGGTNASLTASNGGIFFSSATAGAILAGTATANQLLLSGSSTTPAWSTSTYPATNAANTLLYASSANTMAALATANNGVLVTSNGGVPAWLANSGTPGYVLTANSGAPPSWQASAGDVTSITGTANQVIASAPIGAVTLSLPQSIATSSAVQFASVQLSTNNGILDSAGNEILALTPVASAVNYLSVGNGTTGQGPLLFATGTDADIPIALQTKGNHSIFLQAAVPGSGSTIIIQSGTTFRHVTDLVFADTATSQIVTFPDASGTVSLLGNSSTGTGAVVLSNTPTLITPVLGSASATSINFGGTSLSNYVEGTWTPVLAGSGGGSATYSSQLGGYTLIGNRVFYDLFISITGSTLVGNITITGLPLAAGADNFAASIWANSLGATATTSLSVLLQSGSSALTLWKFTAGSASQLTSTDLGTGAQLTITGQYHV